MPWTNYAKDRFLAPKLSQLTHCGARQLTVTPEESSGWLAGFVLNSAFRVTIADPIRQVMFSYLRRVDGAVLEYTRGQQGLESYVASTNGGITRYSRCLHAFEAAVAMTYQAYRLSQQLIPNKPPLFKKGDGSVLDRMQGVYNAGKHADILIANGNRFAPDSTLPVWITNEALESKECSLSFTELADEIEMLGRIAAALAVLDPPSESVVDTNSAVQPSP